MIGSGNKNISGRNSRASAGNQGRGISAKNNNQNNRNVGGNKNKNQKNTSSAGSKHRVQKINNIQAAAKSNAIINRSSSTNSNKRLESYLSSVKDPSIRRWLSKSCDDSSCNEARVMQPRQQLQQSTDEKETPATPARKRSSLARPVRIHDSCSQENPPPVTVDWDHESQNIQNEQVHEQQMHEQQQIISEYKLKDKYLERSRRKKKKQQERLEQAVDDLVEIRVDEEITISPIRIRLGEFFELSLPNYRRRKRRRRHRMMIATMREKTMKSMLEAGAMRAAYNKRGPFARDTERLLKVLSINNVDQDNGYGVARCSIM